MFPLCAGRVVHWPREPLHRQRSLRAPAALCAVAVSRQRLWRSLDLRRWRFGRQDVEAKEPRGEEGARFI